MDLVSILFIAAASAPPPPRKEIDFDALVREMRTTLDSPYLRDQVTVAMALPYKYGITQMPCKAWQLQPTRGWAPAREPSGKISWSVGPADSVKWAGIYGTCQIQTTVPRDQLSEADRSGLECICNGWLPQGIGDYPLP